MIGLLTFHWADDYGGMLQAYALKSHMQKSEEVKIIPYFPEKLKNRYTLIKTDSAYEFKMSLSSMLDYKSFALRAKRRLNMILFRKRYLSNERSFSDSDKIPSYNKKITKYVVGSDQIWNPEITQGLVDGYFCTFKKSAKRDLKCIAYAASMGSERLDEKYDETLKDLLQNFDSISVREAHIAPYVSGLYGRDVTAVNDPVFLLSKDEWSKLLPKAKKVKPYIFVYYTERNMALIDYAKELAKNKGLEIRLFRQEYPKYWDSSVHFMSGSGPLEFLSYLKGADYVVTNSFHGLAFSVIFQKQLAVFSHSDKNARLTMLLKTANLTDRIVKEDTDFDIDKNIDWQKSETGMNEQIDYSKSFINREIIER